MPADHALVDIMIADAAVAALVGGMGTQARVCVGERRQGEPLPAITTERNGNDPGNTKDGVSVVDKQDVLVYCYASSYPEVTALASAVRTAIDGKKNFTTAPNGLLIQHAWFESDDYFLDQIEDRSIHTIEHRYGVRLVRS